MHGSCFRGEQITGIKAERSDGVESAVGGTSMVVVDAAVVVGLGDEIWSQAIASMDRWCVDKHCVSRAYAESGLVGKSDFVSFERFATRALRRQVLRVQRFVQVKCAFR